MTVADLLGRAIIEECGDRLRKEPDLLTPKTIEALESLPFYQERVADVNAKAEAKVEAQIEAMKLAESRRMDLIGCFLGRGDTPSTAALARIGAATDPLELSNWVVRALKGETAAQIFGA